MAASSPGVRRRSGRWTPATFHCYSLHSTAHPSPIDVHHQCHQSLSTATTPSVKCTDLVLFRDCGADKPQAGGFRRGAGCSKNPILTPASTHWPATGPLHLMRLNLLEIAGALGWCGGRSSSCQTVVCKLGVVP
ncbi:unnamed protein product [Boreogadus saida]